MFKTTGLLALIFAFILALIFPVIPTAQISPLVFGTAATCNGAADDSGAINAAIASANTALFQTSVIMPNGTCKIAVPLTPLSFGVQIKGQPLAHLTPTATMTSMITLDQRFAGVSNLEIDNSGGFATNAIEISKDHDGSPVYIDHVRFSGTDGADFTNCILNSLGDQLVVTNSVFTGYCATAVKIAADGTAGILADNNSVGGNGFWIGHTGTDANGISTNEGIIIRNNSLVTTGYGLQITSCIHCIVDGNVFTEYGYVAGTSPMMINTLSSSSVLVTSSNNWFANRSVAAEPSQTVTISNAIPAVITATAHGKAIGQVVYFATTGGLPTGLAVSTPYYIIAAGFGANAFEVALTPAGAAINTSSAGSGVQSVRGAVCAVRVTGPVNYFSSVQDTFASNGGIGLCLDGSSGAVGVHAHVTDALFYNSSAADIDINATYQTRLLLKGISFSSNFANLNTDANTGGRIDSSDWVTAAINNPSIGSSSFLLGPSGAGLGLVTVNAGTTTITSGAVIGTITHGLWTTPAAADIQVVPTNNPATPYTHFWVTACGATTCTLNIDVAPTSTATFSWKANVSR